MASWGEQFPHLAIPALLDVLQHGADTHADPCGWKKQTIAEHERHAAAHVEAAMRGDRSENHWGHALARIAFALHLRRECVATLDEILATA